MEPTHPHVSEPGTEYALEDIVNLIDLTAPDIPDTGLIRKTLQRTHLVPDADTARVLTLLELTFLCDLIETSEPEDAHWLGIVAQLDIHRDIEYALLACSHLPEYTKWEIRAYGIAARTEYAGNAHTKGEELAHMAKDPIRAVRTAVANSANTTSHTLAELAQDRDVFVRLAAAGNPKTPTHILMQMPCRKSFWMVRRSIAENTATSLRTLELLADDYAEGVREAVAQNRNTPPHILTRLAGDPNRYVKIRVAENPSTPLETLTFLLREPDWHIRKYTETVIEAREKEAQKERNFRNMLNRRTQDTAQGKNTTHTQPAPTHLNQNTPPQQRWRELIQHLQDDTGGTVR